MQQIFPNCVPPLVKPTRNSGTLFRLFAGAIFGLLAACASSPTSRIDADRAQYESWPLEVQEAVLHGEAKKGMTPEQVTMAMGRPSEVTVRSGTGGEDEIWVYRKGSSMGSNILNNSGISIGGAGVNVGTGLGGRRQSPEEYEVVFAKGVVVRSDTDR
jgi:hypothetical protein